MAAMILMMVVMLTLPETNAMCIPDICWHFAKSFNALFSLIILKKHGKKRVISILHKLY